MHSLLIFRSCQGWGVTVTLGVPKAKPEVSAHYAFLLSGRTLKGSLFGGWRPKSDLPSLVDKYANKVLHKLLQKRCLKKQETNDCNVLGVERQVKKQETNDCQYWSGEASR
jgi:Zn-dependent alcohol dehydrogenase